MKVGINGFGRIGRLVLRSARNSNIEFVGVNDITDARRWRICSSMIPSTVTIPARLESMVPPWL